jgi:hypothetical protein
MSTGNYTLFDSYKQYFSNVGFEKDPDILEESRVSRLLQNDPPSKPYGLLESGLVAFVVDLSKLATEPESWPHTSPATYQHGLYRIDIFKGSEHVPDRDDAKNLPDFVRVFRPGDRVPLASGKQVDGSNYPSVSAADLPVFDPRPVREAESNQEESPARPTPFDRYSLLGQSSTFAAAMAEALPLLGDICRRGEVTAWYADPNAGKTLLAFYLLIEAILSQRVAAKDIYYINADDSSAGAAHKLELADQYGINTLIPGQLGFTADQVTQLMRTAAADGTARGLVIIIDTLKKVTSIMDKGQITAFTQAAREFSLAGGTVLALAHTNKNRTAEGKLVYAGTADVVQDFDAAYLFDVLPQKPETTWRTVKIDALKLRTGGARQSGFTYDAKDGLSYDQRLASVRLLTADELDQAHAEAEAVADEVIIAAITSAIRDGHVQKMQLAREVAARAKVGRQHSVRVIEKYAGDDPARHHWTYAVKERGAKVFALLDRPANDGVD